MNPSLLDHYSRTIRYPYCDEAGILRFEKWRFQLATPGLDLPSKTFRYWDVVNRRQRKPFGADRLLYRLPEVLNAVQAGAAVHWTEGEKDADALSAAGVCATSHHQGANNLVPEQAAWLRGVRRVFLWVDKDTAHWEVGAHDAALRFNYLLAAGVPERRIRLVRAAGAGKDAFDHLAAGYAVAEAAPVDKEKLARVAARYSPTSNRRAGYSS